MRKGFPETYDAELLVSAIGTLRMGPTAVPGYSHTTYDVDPSLTRVVGDVDVVLLEGLGFAPLANGETLAAHVDLLIYLDASEEDLETWFRERFMAFWHAAAQDPSSFYAQFRSMSPEVAEQFSRMVWSTINLPNLRNHIVRCRDGAHIVLHKTRDHRLERLRG
jgi:type I pantothenate kinase